MVEENLQHQWILEFLLRQPVEDGLIVRLISSFSNTTWNNRIMTRLLFRRVSSIIHKHHTSQQYDHTIKRVLETLEILAEFNQFNGKLLNLLEMVNSVLANDASEDARNLALHRVRLFLTEATEELGPSYLESIVKTVCEEGQDVEVAGMSIDNQVEVGREGSFNGSDDPLDGNGNNLSKMDDGCFEGNPCVTTKCDSVLIPEFRETTEKGKEICREMAPSILKPALDKVNEKSDEAHFPANASIDSRERNVDALGENLEGNDGNFLGDEFRKMDMHCSRDDSDLSRKKSNAVQTPEFQKGNEAFKSNVLDPKAAVEEPIPDALNLLANVAAERVSSEQPEENKNDEEMDTRDHSVPKECVNIQANEGNIRCSTAVSRPSLMERNTTARTFEWEDEVESSRGSSRHLHLPFLKKRSVTGRRRAKRWSALEEQVLRDAVKQHGRGNWKLILENYGEIFEERTVVDLKDKWRNMTR